MSLDVYLTMKGVAIPNQGSGIYVRENRETREITRAEWNAKFPSREPIITEIKSEGATVYSANITHNLNKMAGEAGLYEYLWRPEEVGISRARQLITPLRAGLSILKNDRQRFEQFNPSNGWGDYDGLVRFVENYLAACIRFPDAEVYASR